jgi:hypothetical protein
MSGCAVGLWKRGDLRRGGRGGILIVSGRCEGGACVAFEGGTVFDCDALLEGLLVSEGIVLVGIVFDCAALFRFDVAARLLGRFMVLGGKVSVGTVLVDSFVLLFDCGIVVLFECGTVLFEDVTVFLDGRTVFSDGRTVFSDGRTVFSDGRTVFSDGRTVFSDGRTVF